MWLSFQKFIQANGFLSTSPTLLAVSGGVDSMVLTHLWHRTGQPFSIAHANFGLRGSDSVADEEFVREQASCYGVNCYVTRFNTKHYADSISIQMAARKLRYDWFESLKEQYHFTQIALGHHWDDGLETILFNLFKGTGISGLQGIPVKRNSYIRPLYFASKQDILSYAKSQGLKWREDSSNASSGYHRNRIRHHIVPEIRKINPKWEQTMHSTVARLSQTKSLFQHTIHEIQQQTVQKRGANTVIDTTDFKLRHWAGVVTLELLKPFGFKWNHVNSLLGARTGALFYTSSHRLCVDRNQWVIAPIDNIDTCTIQLSSATGTYQINTRTLHVGIRERTGYTLPSDLQVAALDYDKLTFPLTVRLWRHGDRFQPLGMTGHKKVSDLLIDYKVSKIEKANVYVVTTIDTEIVWVMGLRINHAFRVTTKTTHIWEMKLVQ